LYKSQATKRPFSSTFHFQNAVNFSLNFLLRIAISRFVSDLLLTLYISSSTSLQFRKGWLPGLCLYIMKKEVSERELGNLSLNESSSVVVIRLLKIKKIFFYSFLILIEQEKRATPLSSVTWLKGICRSHLSTLTMKETPTSKAFFLLLLTMRERVREREREEMNEWVRKKIENMKIFITKIMIFIISPLYALLQQWKKAHKSITIHIFFSSSLLLLNLFSRRIVHAVR
jgi:hypothetical protein